MATTDPSSPVVARKFQMTQNVRLVFLVIMLQSILVYIGFMDKMKYGQADSSEGSYLPSLLSNFSGKEKQLGAFVFKVRHPVEALRSLCILDRFFNHGPKYPIRVFSDQPVSNTTIEQLNNINPLVDVQVIVDEKEKWRQLPPELSEFELEEIKKNCSMDDKCTLRLVPKGYVHMGYWRYRRMAFEEALQDFEYFVSWDTDAFLTRPMQCDPFLTMQQNNLTGFFVNEASSYAFNQGIASAARRVFGHPKNTTGFLNSADTFPLFDTYGNYNHRSIYGYLYGGRLDFFRSPKFREFSGQIVPYTYKHRVDEQVVIAMAWSMMASDSIWHFPSHNCYLGIWHYGLLDNELLMDCNAESPPSGVRVYNNSDLDLCYWANPRLVGRGVGEFHVNGPYGVSKYWAKYPKLVASFLPPDNHTLTQEFDKCMCHPSKGSIEGDKVGCE